LVNFTFFSGENWIRSALLLLACHQYSILCEISRVAYSSE